MAPTQTDGRKLYGNGIPIGASPSGWKGKKNRVKIFRKESARNRHVIFWHPPVCLNYVSESGCKCGDKCEFLHTEAGGQPSEKSKKSWRKKIGCFVVREYSNSLCVPRQSSEKVYSIGLCVP